jgi:BASS family bile acid:Na+ symporter
MIPTAVAAPILAQIMNRNVGVVTFSVILTTPVIALVAPLLLLFVLDISGQFSMYDLIFPIITLIGIPLLLSQIIRWLAPLNLMGSLSKLGAITFPLFLLNLFIACGDASRFIQQNTQHSIGLLLGILATAATVALVQFQIGRFIGDNNTNVEFSLALGRKNTMLGIWIALTYFEPIVVLGPVCYILIQNIYNSFEIWYLDQHALQKKNRRSQRA